MAYDFSKFKAGVKGTEEWLKQELSQIRTGRATPMLLDSISIDSYGSQMSIQQIGSVSVEDPRTLRIVPWDMSQAKSVEKSIIAADLGVSVSIDDKGLRVMFPELTSERRTSLMKISKQKIEDAKITLRQEREKVISDIEAKEKQGGMGEDEKFRLKAEVQKMVDACQKNLMEAGDKKEKEIMN
ncbi:MAG: ribosome recycling factor [Candidatus Paceibacterota bacterium]|jgi:ribosome recycling factor